MELFGRPVPKAYQVPGATAEIPVSPEMTAVPPGPLFATVPDCWATAAVEKSYSKMLSTQPPGGALYSSFPASCAAATVRVAVSSELPMRVDGTTRPQSCNAMVQN